MVPIRVKSRSNGSANTIAPVGGLEDVAAVVLEQAPHHDVAALDEPHRRWRLPRAIRSRANSLSHGPVALTRTRAVATSRRPRTSSTSRQSSPRSRADAARAGADHGAALGRVERVEHDQARIVHPAIGIFEAALVSPALERRAERIIGEIERAGRGQDLPAAEMVVDEQPQPQQPGRAQARRRRQHEAHRPDQVRRHAQHDLALDQRLAHQAEPAVLEIAQPAVDQLGRGRGGAGREIVLLDQQHPEPAAGGVAGDARRR